MRSIVNITGRLEQGKSTLAYHLARQLNSGVLIFDPGTNFGIGSRCHDLEEMLAALDRDESPIVFHPFDVWPEFFAFHQGVWTTRNVAVLVDEASLLQSPQRIHPALDQLVRMGKDRNGIPREISVITTQHRIADIHGLLQTLVREYYFFQTKTPRELEKIEEIASAEVAARVSELERFQYLCFDVASQSFHVHKDPSSWREEINPAAELERKEVAA